MLGMKVYVNSIDTTRGCFHKYDSLSKEFVEECKKSNDVCYVDIDNDIVESYYYNNVYDSKKYNIDFEAWLKAYSLEQTKGLFFFAQDRCSAYTIRFKDGRRVNIHYRDLDEE